MAQYENMNTTISSAPSNDCGVKKSEAHSLMRDIDICNQSGATHRHVMQFKHLVKKLGDASPEGERLLEAELDSLIARVKYDIETGNWNEDDLLKISIQ